MPFDPRAGFDAEAYAAIESTLPPGTNPDAVFPNLEDAAVAHLRRREPAMDRDRIARGLKLIDKNIAWLRTEWRHPSVADDGGATRRALEALGELKLHLEPALRSANAKVRANKGTGDPDQEQLYSAILRAWADAVGKPTVGDPKTGGPCVRYLIAAVEAITGGKLSVGGARKIILRQG